jgi:hypothetical protein
MSGRERVPETRLKKDIEDLSFRICALGSKFMKYVIETEGRLSCLESSTSLASSMESEEPGLPEEVELATFVDEQGVIRSLGIAAKAVEDIDPCGWCGNEHPIVCRATDLARSHFFVKCDCCGVQGPTSFKWEWQKHILLGHYQDAIEVWNRFMGQ